MKPAAPGAYPLRARAMLWYTLVLLSVLLAFAISIVWQQERIGLRRVDRELEAVATTLDHVFREEMSETHDPVAAAVDARATMALPGRAMAILDADGRPLAAVWNGFDTHPESFRVNRHAITIDGRRFVLLVAAPAADVVREKRQATEAMLIGLPVVLLLATAGGFWLTTSGPVVAELRAALERQRQFMADASHELRTPVSVIQSSADVTLGRSERTADEYRETISIVGTEARRLARLVDDMLVLARADAGGYRLRREHLYLAELVAECRRTVEVLARDRDVAVRTSADGDVPFTGDENLLRRMLLNLLQNAVSHTRAGGVVEVDLTRDTAFVCIRVTDQGEGIPPPDRARIFDRFVQLDPSRSVAGAGLGLPIARWIAEAHGGGIVLEDSRTSGSTFTITLPC